MPASPLQTMCRLIFWRMLMPVTLGVLGDSYRRQLRRPRGRPPVDIVLAKVAAVGDEFGIRPLGVDFSVGQLPQTDEAYLDDLRGRLAARGLIPTVIVGSLMLHADEDLWRPPLERTAANLAVAHRLGSPIGLFYLGYGGRVNHEGRIRLAAEQIARLADAAADLGMLVTTENYDYFTSDDFLEIFARVDRPNVGLHTDTGNWLVLGEDPLAATRKMAPFTYHAHVRDYVLRDGVFTSVPIGQGALDFPPILDELKRIGETRDRFVLAVEMDLDAGDAGAEDDAVRACVRYMADWYERTIGALAAQPAPVA